MEAVEPRTPFYFPAACPFGSIPPMRHAAALLALLLAPVLLAANTPSPDTPKSTAAVSAINRAARAQAEAEQAFHESVLAAKKMELLDLKLAQDGAMKQGGAEALAEANRIAAVIGQVQAEVEAMEKGAATRPTTKPALAENAGKTEQVWLVRWNDGANWFKVRPDGSAVNSHGRHGKWKQRGAQVDFDWGNEQDTFTLNTDGAAATGKNNGSGGALAAEVVKP